MEIIKNINVQKVLETSIMRYRKTSSVMGSMFSSSRKHDPLLVTTL